MKKLYVVSLVLFLSTQFLCLAHAIDLCETEDYYNLADSSKCKLKYNETSGKSDSRELMFEVLKNYPYENKETVVKLLEKKIKRVDNYIIEQRGKKQTEKIEVNISKLEQSKQELSEQLAIVTAATVDNWVNVRDQATNTLREATKRLQEVE